MARPAAKVLTVSDACSRGEREDSSGPAVAEALRTGGFDVVGTDVVPDGRASVAATLRRMVGGFSGLIVTTGGTGMAPTDMTPEGTLDVVERSAPGLAEAMRAVNPLGRLSRGVAGTVGACLIVNLPGSPRGALECLESVVDVLPHALELLGGGGSAHPH